MPSGSPSAHDTPPCPHNNAGQAATEGGDDGADFTQPPAANSGTGQPQANARWWWRFLRSPLCRWLAVAAFVLLLIVLLSPWWGRPLLQSAVRSALLEQGWQTVQVQVSALGASQASLSDIVLERPEAQLRVPSVSLRYSLPELLTRRRVQTVIVNNAQMQAHFAHSPADLVGALLLADWPRGEQLPFRRIYINNAQISAQPSAGLQPLQLDALLEHTPPAGQSPSSAKLWASATSPAPYAQLEFTFEANLRERTLKATLDSTFRDLPAWRSLPLPPEALETLNIVREELSLQGGASVNGRTMQSWMLFGQSPAAVFTAPDGSHIEALGVDFGINIHGTDALAYGWVRAASGAASGMDGSIEWQNLRAEIKPGQYLSAHIDSAAIRAGLSSVARELMPNNRLTNEAAGLWQNHIWQANDLSVAIFAPEAQKNRPAFMRLAANLQLGSLQYPWERLEPLPPSFETRLRSLPLLNTLAEGAPPQPQPAANQTESLITLPAKER